MQLCGTSGNSRLEQSPRKCSAGHVRSDMQDGVTQKGFVCRHDDISWDMLNLQIPSLSSHCLTFIVPGLDE